MRRVAAILAVAVLIAAGCSSDDPGAAPTTTAGATTTTTLAEPTAADRQLEWYLGVLSGTDVTSADYEARFAQTFRDAVPFDQFISITVQLRANSPYTLNVVTPQGSLGLVAEVAGADGAPLIISLTVDTDDRIEGLFVQPKDVTLDDPPESVDGAFEQLEEIGNLRVAASTVDGSTCTAGEARDAEEPGPIASVFKLYVLGAVADAIAAGDLTWTEELTITADVKSLPTGVLQDRPDGSKVTVREAAELMIKVSDNTAADLLSRRVGREAVEQAQGDYGHGAPELNRPFPTTRELFALKVASSAVRQAWIDGDEGARRSILDSLAEVDLDEIPITAFAGDPLQPDEIEWFASPMDLCRAIALLSVKGDTPGLEPLTDVLTLNPGVPGPDGLWSRIYFKGGGEPGLVAAAWLVEAPDGRRFALTGSVVDPDDPIDTEQAILLLAAARDLLATT